MNNKNRIRENALNQFKIISILKIISVNDWEVLSIKDNKTTLFNLDWKLLGALIFMGLITKGWLRNESYYE